MAYILNIETATKNCSVSVAQNGQVLAIKEIATQGFAHAENLHLFIQYVLNKANIKKSELNAVAVSEGPGSYTGLRIGVSAAKGLCFALDIPLIAINTLEILANQLKITDGVIASMIDARRMEVFMCVYDKFHEKMSEVTAEIITENTLDNYVGKVYLIGDGALKCEEFLNDDRFVYNSSIQYPSANEMAVLSQKKFEIHQFVNLAYFEPYYLKDFVLTTSPKK